jgi:hypothetical protein
MKKIWNWLLIENNRKLLSFLGTGIAVIIAAIWTYFVYFDQAETRMKSGKDVRPTLQSSQSPLINIGATWREIYPNPGSLSQIIQDGDTFKFLVEGAIQGSRFQSSGTGTIKGKNIESTYQSTIPSTGHCSGIVSPDGMQTKSTCIDSVHGQYETTWVRQ